MKFKVFIAGNPTPYIAVADPIPVVNRLIMYEHPDTELSPDAVPLVNAEMTNKNYVLNPVNGGAWTRSQYLGDLSGTNALMLDSHGSVTASAHLSGANEWIYARTYLLSLGSSYEESRTAQVGPPPTWPLFLDAPPYNNGDPPVNFCHLVACVLARLPESWTVGPLYPGVWRYGSIPYENQATFAYWPYIVTGEASTHAQLVWSRMAGGYTAWWTREDIVDQQENRGIVALMCWDDYTNDGDNQRYMVDSDFWVFGDTATRVKSVYTGGVGPPVGWYR